MMTSSFFPYAVPGTPYSALLNTLTSRAIRIYQQSTGILLPPFQQSSASPRPMRFLRKTAELFKALVTSGPPTSGLAPRTIGSLIPEFTGRWKRQRERRNPPDTLLLETPAVLPHLVLSEEQANPPQPGPSRESTGKATDCLLGSSGLLPTCTSAHQMHRPLQPTPSFLCFCIRVFLQGSVGGGHHEDTTTG